MTPGAGECCGCGEPIVWAHRHPDNLMIQLDADPPLDAQRSWLLVGECAMPAPPGCGSHAWHTESCPVSGRWKERAFQAQLARNAKHPPKPTKKKAKGEGPPRARQGLDKFTDGWT